MKKALCFFMVIITLLSLTACSGISETEAIQIAKQNRFTWEEIADQCGFDTYNEPEYRSRSAVKGTYDDQECWEVYLSGTMRGCTLRDSTFVTESFSIYVYVSFEGSILGRR